MSNRSKDGECSISSKVCNDYVTKFYVLSEQLVQSNKNEHDISNWFCFVLF